MLRYSSCCIEGRQYKTMPLRVQSVSPVFFLALPAKQHVPPAHARGGAVRRRGGAARGHASNTRERSTSKMIWERCVAQEGGVVGR